MITTYGHTHIQNCGAGELRSSKAVAKEMTGCRHTVGILFEYGWSMVRVWLEYVVTGRKLVYSCPGKPVLRTSESETPFLCQRNAVSLLAKRRFVVTLLLMLFVGVTGVKGQTVDYSGKYYIAFAGKSVNNYDAGNLENNYYLCPTENWCYYKATNDFYPSDTEDENKTMPFLTTYRCKKASYNYDYVNKALWTIVKKNGQDMYYIKQGERYLVLNGQINTSNNANRIRVHLEAFTSTDLETEDTDNKALFEITPNKNGGMKIRPKNINGSWLNVTNGNYDNLIGNSGKNGGPTGYENVAGTIGIWNEENYEARCYLEDHITRPTISYSGNDVLITYPTSATIYYTIDGSDPTDANNTNRSSFTGTSHTVSFEDVANIKAAAYINGEYSNIAKNVYVHIGSSNPYLLQSVANTDFYMIAGEANGSNYKVNTSSLPQAGMSWHFEDAGFVDGVQCYYVKNTSKNGYIRRDGTSFYITSTAPANSNDYKFAVIPHYNGSILEGYDLYNIGGKLFVAKAGSNNTNNDAYLTKDADNVLARWNPILVANKNFPSPVTLSDNSSATYYTIQSMDATSYFITLPTATYVTTSTGTSDSQKWYFMDAGNDGWASYYYILNAVTGEAMCFNGTESTDNQADALVMSPLPSTPTDNYKFAIANTWGEGVYYIIPKPLAQFAQTNYTAIWREGLGSLQTRQNRQSNKIKWQITAVPNYVAPPHITYDVTSNMASLSCTTPGATIYYTTDGTEATTSSTNTIPTNPNSFVLSAGIQTIRAIAVKAANSSNESTYEIVVQPTLTNNAVDLRPYLIQSKEVQYYYMMPSVEVGGYQTVNTLNVPCKEMAWYFEYATTDDGIHYYYIRNSQGGYIYHSEDNIYINDINEGTDAYKFKLVGSSANGYRMTPKDASNPLYKVSIGTAAVSLANNTNSQSLWGLIPYNGRTSLPQWTDVPFDESTNVATHYYQITSTAQTTKPIILNNNGDVKSAVVPSIDYDTRKGMWIIQKVGSDTDNLLDYYTITNAYTGEKLFYNGAGRNALTNAFQVGMPSATGADDTWSHFVIVQTAGGYNIIPRVIVDNTKDEASKAAYNCISRTSGTDVLGTYYDNGPGARWTFDEVTIPVKCMNPVFTEAGGAITVSCITNAADIYFTIEGSDPTANGVTPTLYTNQNWPASTQHRIKAFAKLKNDATSGSNSDVVILLNKPDIEIGVGPYTYKGEAWEPAVTQVSVGASGSETVAPTFPATYTVTYSNNIHAGTASVSLEDVAGDLWYIWNATKPFTIDKKNLDITAEDETKEYDGTALTSDSYTHTDLATGDNITNVTFTGSQTAVGSSDNVPSAAVIKNAGNVNVTANYTITYTNGTLTVTKRALTIIADSETKEYDGIALTKNSYTTNKELASGDHFESVVVTGSQTILGSSDNVASAAVIKNANNENMSASYEITYVNGTLTIIQKALNKDAIGTPADGITATITKDATDQNHITYHVTVKQGGITLTPYNENDPTANYDYTVSGEVSASGYVATVTARDGGNYSGFIELIFADPKFWDDGAPYDPTVAYDPNVATNHEYAAVFLSISDLVPTETNVKAYIVKKVNPSVGTVSISPVEFTNEGTQTKVNYIPEGIPVLLLSNNDNIAGLNTSPKDENAPGVTDAFVNSNQLKVAPEGGVTVKDKEAYMFYRGEFVLVKAGTIRKDNFYIPNPNYKASGEGGSSSRSTLHFVIEEDEATGILDAETDSSLFTLHSSLSEWFTLDGRRLNGKPSQKGLYIQNGKKVMVK